METDAFFGDSTELLYLRARQYTSNTGRFLTKDTWAGNYNSPLTLNRWNYVDGNPVNRADPSGHCYGGSFWDLFKPPYFGPCSSSASSPVQVTSTPILPPTSTSAPVQISTPIPQSMISPTSTPQFSYDTIAANSYALNHWPFDITSDSDCSLFLSRILDAGGVNDPTGQWTSSTSDTTTVFNFLTGHFAWIRFTAPDNNGIHLRNNPRWEDFISIHASRVHPGDVVFYKVSNGGVVGTIYDHAAYIVNTGLSETTMFIGASTNNAKPRIVEADGLLNDEIKSPCQPPGEPNTNASCGWGDYAIYAGRSIDDTDSMIYEVVIVLMQEPR